MSPGTQFVSSLPRLPPGGAGERGAVLVHVAVSLVGLLAFSALAIDYGVLWVSRSQIQNAADAAALAGATSVAFDDPESKERAGDSGDLLNAANPVWGAASYVVMRVEFDMDLGCPPDARGDPSRLSCVRADIYRGGRRRAEDGQGTAPRGTPLPTYFAGLTGVRQQGVRATATAQVLVGSATRCMRPWAIPDRLVPYAPTPGDLGRQLTLQPADPSLTPVENTYYPLALPGLATYGENVTSCYAQPLGLGDTVTTDPAPLEATTYNSVVDLIAEDPGATFVISGTDNVMYIDRTCAKNTTPCAPISPRLVPIVIVDGAQYEAQRLLTPGCAADRRQCVFTLPVKSVAGFFVRSVTPGGQITGHLMHYPGIFVPGAGTTATQSFLRAVTLIR